MDLTCHISDCFLLLLLYLHYRLANFVFKYDVIGLEITVYRKILFDSLYQINFGAPDK